MRQLRVLAQGVWYEVRTSINNREPLFRRYQALAIFTAVFNEAKLRFVFEICKLRLEDDWLKFYIKPEDGLELPDIMKWLTHCARRAAPWMALVPQLSAKGGEGDRYWSRIVEGEPGEEAAVTGDRPRQGGSTTGVRPRRRRKARPPRFFFL